MFDIPASLVQRIAKIGLSLQFDVWPPTRTEGLSTNDKQLDEADDLR